MVIFYSYVSLPEGKPQCSYVVPPVELLEIAMDFGCKIFPLVLSSWRYEEALSDAQRAVQVDASYAKGFYRMAICQKEGCIDPVDAENAKSCCWLVNGG